MPRLASTIPLLVLLPSSPTPAVEPLLKSIQAAYESACPSEKGAFVVVASSSDLFREIAPFAEKQCFVVSTGSQSDLLRWKRSLSENEGVSERISWVHIPEDGTNEFSLNQHSLGYGSLSYVLALRVASEDFHNKSFFCGVKLLLVPGEHSGWLAGSACLAHKVPQSQGVTGDLEAHLSIIPEQRPTLQRVTQEIVRTLERHGRATVVLSLGGLKSLMEHLPSRSPARRNNATLLAALGEIVRSTLGTAEPGMRVPVRTEDLTQPGRHLIRRISVFDQTLATTLGTEALRHLAAGKTEVVLISRKDGHQEKISCVPVSQLPNSPKKIPEQFLQRDSLMPTTLFLNYASRAASLELRRSRHSDAALETSVSI